MSRPRRPPSRNIHGIVLLDKPAGLSSNQALQRVKWLFKAAKAGHTGSLDPLATGLLPICLGEATKIAGLLLGSEKAYRTTARLGVTTDTDDADGAVLLERPLPALSEAMVREALAPLIGRTQQRPPIYSALKQGGEALYRKARRGEVIEVPAREVEVRRIELLHLDGDQVHAARSANHGRSRPLVLDRSTPAVRDFDGFYIDILGAEPGQRYVLEVEDRWLDIYAMPLMPWTVIWETGAAATAR